MVESIRIGIELDGGDEIDRQLADTAEAGKKMFADLQDSADQLNFSDVSDQFKNVGTAIESAQTAIKSASGFEQIIQGVKNVEGAFETLGTAATKMATRMTKSLGILGVAARSFGPVGIAVGAVGAALVKFGNDSVTSINEIVASAGKLGLTVQQFDTLRTGFERAGISSEAIRDGLQRLQGELSKIDVERVKKAFDELQEAAGRGFGTQGTAQLKILEEAAKGIGPAADAARVALEKLGVAAPQIDNVSAAMQRLGISSTDLATAVPQVVEKLRQMPDSVERTNLAISALGPKLGTELIAALRTGGVAVDQFKQQIGGLTQEQQIAAAQQEQASNRMSAAWNEFKANVAGPVLIPLFDFMKSELDEINRRIETTKREWAALVSFLSSITPKTTIDISLTQSLAPQIEAANQKLRELGQTGQQAGQQVAQGLAQTGQATEQVAQGFLQLQTNPFTGMVEVIRTTNQELQQTGAAAQTAAQGFLQLQTNPFTGMVEVIRTTNQELQQTGQAAQQAGQTSAEAGQQAVSAWQTINQAVIDAGTAIGEFVAKLGSITWDAISSTGVAAWNGLTGAIGGAASAVANFFSTLASGAWDKVKQLLGLGGGGRAGTPGMARGGLLGGRGTGTSDSNLAWLSRGEYIMPARAVRQPGVLSFLEALRRSGGIPGFAKGGAVGGTADILSRGQQVVMDGISGAIEAIHKAVETIDDQILEVLNSLARDIEQAMASVTRGLGQAVHALWQSMGRVVETLNEAMEATTKIGQGLARGGLLGGRGTGTSDSNLAWVSRGEHIMPARAVRQPGVLAFLEALRRSGGNLSRVLDGMGRFALGGMIPRAIPAFASGGLAGGMSNVTIQFPGLPAISGLRASSDVVDQLHKAAALAQVRSGGRKPSRYS